MAMPWSQEAWKQEAEAKEVPEANNVTNPLIRSRPEPKPEHVHEWTVFPSGKRKCKPCGAVERPERNE